MKKIEIKRVDKSIGSTAFQTTELFVDGQEVTLTQSGSMAFYGWMISASKDSPKLQRSIKSFAASAVDRHSDWLRPA